MSAPDPATGHVVDFADHVDVGDEHAIYVEVSGNPEGIPVVFLHGGPGSGCQPGHRRLFDAERYRLILFDQRGAGRSRPRRGRNANTTEHLIADLERLRHRFGIERWLVVGGSWGATLALAYTERHPVAVRGLALRSVFLGTRAELDRAFLQILPMFHPGLYDDFLAQLLPADRRRPLGTYWNRILDPDPAVHRPAALAWHDTERILSQIVPGANRLDPARLADPKVRLPATPFMEAHYFRSDCFLADRPILEHAGALAGVPGVIVQARYDLLCLPATAHALVGVWPDARVVEVSNAGHTLSDGGTEDALRRAIDDLARV